MDFKIQKQTEAEKDQYLIECFHDAGFIKELVKNNYSIISGRKGAGKTALARYLEDKALDFGIDFACRISVRNISFCEEVAFKSQLNSILFFVIIRTIQESIKKDIFSDDSKKYWIDFLIQNGLQNISDYEAFVESQKENKVGFSILGRLSSCFAKMGGDAKTESTSKLSKTLISNTPASLIEALKESLPQDKFIYIFIDDISDYLDDVQQEKLKDELVVIRELLLSLENYNSIFNSLGKNLRFISLMRDDLFEFMEGSNVNKLINDSLKIEWNEKSFAGLLIRRLPFFQENIKNNLENPIESIRRQFPDEIFAETLKEFKTNRCATNFYAYILAISFNRPRDFLKFCYAMRDRLSMTDSITFENIDSAEIEYSDYFMKELRDELFMISRLLRYEFNQENIDELIDLLSQKEGFNIAQLKTEFGQYLGVKTKIGWNRIQEFIKNLWIYGILGYKEKQDDIIQFKYIFNSSPIIMKKLKDYSFYLHRGLWWFAKKRKK